MKSWVKGGYMALIIGVIIEGLLFLTGHICQFISKANTSTCKLFIIPFAILSNLFPFSSYRLNYVLAMLVFLIAAALIAGLIAKIKEKIR